MVILGCRPLEDLTGHEAGRELLAQLWQQHMTGPLPPIAVAERGKPYFPDSPWHFSISHTKKRVFCALSDRPLGLDAEEADRDIDLRLARKIRSPAERIRYESCPDKRRALLTFWVLKEAAAKLTGEGLRGYPNHTDFSPEDPRVTEMEGCLVAVLTDA